MMPLSYAITLYFTTCERACADDVLAALSDEYGNNRNLNLKYIKEILLTDRNNGLLSDDEAVFCEDGSLKLYYHADENQKKIINSYLRRKK